MYTDKRTYLKELVARCCGPVEVLPQQPVGSEQVVVHPRSKGIVVERDIVRDLVHMLLGPGNGNTNGPAAKSIGDDECSDGDFTIILFGQVLHKYTEHSILFPTAASSSSSSSSA